MKSSSANKSPEPSVTNMRKSLIKSKEKLSADEFELIRILGTGGYATVWLACFKSDPQKNPFALKIIQKSSALAKKQENNVLTERRILSTLHHPAIVELVASFQDKYCLYLLFEFLQGGELFMLLKIQKRLNQSSVAFYLAEVTRGISFLHKHGIIYRDIKPENILITTKGHVKLVDFGFAKKLESSERTFTVCGTPEYLAPEVILPSRPGYTKKVDYWALGVLTYELSTGYLNQNTTFLRRKAHPCLQKHSRAKFGDSQKCPASCARLYQQPHCLRA